MTSNGSSGLHALRQSLSEIQVLLQRSTVTKIPQFPSLDVLKQLPLDEVSWRRLLLESLPANTRALERIEQHLANIIDTVGRQGAAPATTTGAATLPTAAQSVIGAPQVAEPPANLPQVRLPVVAAPVISPVVAEPASVRQPDGAAPLVTTENMVVAFLTTPTVTVGTESESEVDFKDLLDKPVKFVHLAITEVDIAAPQLANADDVRLRLFQRRTRLVPQDLVAEFTGSSLITGTWQASFSNRRIEYTDVSGRSKLYIAIRNTAGNSGPSIFDLRFYARVFQNRDAR